MAQHGCTLVASVRTLYHLAVLPDSSLCAWWRLRVAYSSLAKLEWVSLQSQSWLQPRNAMCTSHFGAIVRTTHVTGTAGLSKGEIQHDKQAAVLLYHM